MGIRGLEGQTVRRRECGGGLMGQCGTLPDGAYMQVSITVSKQQLTAFTSTNLTGLCGTFFVPNQNRLFANTALIT